MAPEERFERIDAQLELVARRYRIEMAKMTPEQRFEKIETQLELVARYLTRMGERGDQNAESLAQIGARMDQLTAGMGQLTARMDQMTTNVDRTSQDMAKLVGAVASLVKLFERHIGDGHGGKE